MNIIHTNIFILTIYWYYNSNDYNYYTKNYILYGFRQQHVITRHSLYIKI